MIYSVGDLGIEINFGPSKPGAIFQRIEQGDWLDYSVNGEPVTNPFNVELLPPGYYRPREPRPV